MKSKIKWVSWGFFSLDYKAMEAYLEELAAKGWMLEKVWGSVAKFRAIEPQKLKFYVDVFKEGGPLTPEKTEESEEYRKLCQESGWIFITSKDYLQFFHADVDSEPVPIQTDEALEQKIVELTLVRNELRSIFIFLIIAAFILFSTFPVRYINLLSFTGVAGTILFPILCIFTLIPAVYSIIWMLRVRRNIKDGFPIDKPNLKNARRRIMAFNIPVLVTIFFFILAFIGDAFFDFNKVALVLMGPVIGTALGMGIRFFIKKKLTKKEDSVQFVVIAALAIIISMPILSSLITENSTVIYKVDSIPRGYPIVTVEEILGESKNGSVLSREFKPGMSPIVPRHYDYWEIMDIDGQEKNIDIKYYKAVNPFFAEIIIDGIADKLEKGLKFRGEYFFKKTIITDDEMTDLWGADMVTLTEERDEIIIQKGNIVLHLSGNINFNDRQTRELIISRFFSDFE